MTLLVFTDLDDTLFTSMRKAPPDGSHQPLAFLADGSPISYASRTQQAWLAHWQQHAILIPVTARNHDAYRRVHLSFSAHAVINYGGIILNPDGSPDPDWRDDSAQHAKHSAPRLQALAERMHGRRSDLNIRIVEDFGIPFYLVIKSSSGEALDDIAAELAAHLTHPGDKLHHNGNNLAVIPGWLDKAHAVAHLLAQYRQQYGEIVSIGMGDSRIDLGFMRHCDYLIAPQRSQIVQQW